MIIGPPKTRKALRTITVPRLVADALGEHLANGDVISDSFVFTDSIGGPLRRTHWVRRVWAPATRAVGLEGLTPHALRHSTSPCSSSKVSIRGQSLIASGTRR